MKAPGLSLLPILGFSLACTGILGGDTAADTGASGTDACKWYRDQDGDGFGDALHKEATCEKPSGYVANDDDCDDQDARAHPEATEKCDGVDADEDCNGVADEEDEGVVLDTFTPTRMATGMATPKARLPPAMRRPTMSTTPTTATTRRRAPIPTGRRCATAKGATKTATGSWTPKTTACRVATFPRGRSTPTATGLAP